MSSTKVSAGEGKAVIGTEERYEENLVSSRVPGLSPLLKPWINTKRGVLGEENNRNCVVMSCTNHLTYRCLLSAVIL